MVGGYIAAQDKLAISATRDVNVLSDWSTSSTSINVAQQRSSTGLGTQTASADGKAGNIDISAKTVVMNAAYDTTSRTLTTQGSQLTVGGTLSVPIVNAARSAFDTAQATTRTSDGRMQALGAATAGYQGYQAYEAASALAAGGSLGYKVGAALTNSHTATTSTETSSTAVGSTVWGAGNVKITASGGGAASNITATGATLSGNNVTLEADNAVTLQAAQNTTTQTSSSSGSKQTLGASYSVGAQNGFTIDVGASQSKGSGNGRDVTQVNTYVNADNTLTIRSGGSTTTLSGAVLTADTVKVDVGGNLNITSLQDTSTSTSKQSGGGFDVSLCVIWCAGTPVTGSVSGNTAKGSGNYASANESTGIQAGDGGFQVNVAGSTNLVGGVIASTQGAVDAGVNTFATGSLTTSNVVNHDIGRGSGYSLNASYSGAQSGGLSQDGNSTTSSGIGGGAGFGTAGGTQTSVTTAGISGIAGNAGVRTGDPANGLARQYANAGALLGEVQTQLQITSAFTNTFGPVVADAAVSWLTALFAPTGVTAVPTPGNPTPAATELVRSDQATRKGFATIQGDPTLSLDLKTFMLDLKTIYDNDGFVQDAVHRAVTDPLAYQMSLTGSDPNNPMVKVIFPAVAAAGAGSSTVAGGAAASLASAVATSGLKYDPLSDTYTSASGGVAPGAFVRALSNVSGTAMGLLDAGTAGLVNALQTQLPLLGKLVVTVTAVAMNAANGDGSSGSGPTGGNQADTYGTPPDGASPPPDGDNRDSSASAGEVRTVSIRNRCV